MSNSQKMTIDEARKILGISTYDIKDAEIAYSALNIKLLKKIRTPGVLAPERIKISQQIKSIKLALKVIKDHANAGSQTTPPNSPPTPPNPNVGPGSASNAQSAGYNQNFKPPPPTPYTPQNTTSRNFAYYLSLFVSVLQNIFGFLKWLSPWVVRGIVLFAKGLAFIPWQMVNSLTDRKYYKFTTYALTLLVIIIIAAYMISLVDPYPLIAEVRFLTVPWCHIFVNNKKLGLSGTAKAYQLLPGKYKIRLQTDDGKFITKEIELPVNSKTVVKANLDSGKFILERQ